MQFISSFFAKKLIGPMHLSAVSSRRIKVLSNKISLLLPKYETLTGLDVGCGSGELAKTLQELRPLIKISGTDVLVRRNAAINIVQFDGNTLPFEDKSFDFTMLVDVLHHTNNPLAVLRECVRVSRKFIILKDHFCESWWDRWRLCFMDWVGNRAYDVHLPYNYLSQNKWKYLYHNCGIVCATQLSHLNLYHYPFSLVFDSDLNFVHNLAILDNVSG